jgi:hypothetical protein
MKIKIGERYRAPNDCACGKCCKLDSIVVGISNGMADLKCCNCGNIESLGIEDEMFDEFLGEPFKLITKTKLIKERLKAPFEGK